MTLVSGACFRKPTSAPARPGVNKSGYSVLSTHILPHVCLFRKTSSVSLEAPSSVLGSQAKPGLKLPRGTAVQLAGC